MNIRCRGRTRTTDLMPVCRSKPTSDCALPTELHGIPYIIYPSYKQLAATPACDIRDAEPIRIIGLAIRIPYFKSFRLLLCYSNHSAFNSHNFPRPYTTTYLFSMLLCHSNHYAPTRGALRFGNYLLALAVLHDPLSCRLFPHHLALRFQSLSLPFQLRALHDPLRDYSPPILPLCIQYIQPTYRDCTLHVPRRLWKVRDSNPRAISDSRVSGAVLSASQPTFLVLYVAIP